MDRRITYGCVLLLLACLIFFPGCAILQLPFQVLGKLIDLAARMPKPPPWVFL